MQHSTLIDGKYTTCALEAALTGAIVFWHATLNLGNDFETFFNLPVDPAQAAQKILEIRETIQLPNHSKWTREEVLDKCSAANSVRFRCEKILEQLETHQGRI